MTPAEDAPREPPGDPLPASVLVTGAQGNLGQRTLRALAPLPLVRGLDRAPGAGIMADLAAPPETWRHHLRGVEVLIHLAAEPSPAASRAVVERDNIAVTRALLRAAAEAGVRRVVFASSCHVLAGYRFHRGPLDPQAPPFPVSPYGWSKAASEEDGRLWAAETGGTFLALRIGLCLREGAVWFSQARRSRWMQSILLTDDDFAKAIRRATLAEVTGFQAITLCSAVKGAPWDQSAARRILGHVATPLPSPRVGLRQALTEIRDRTQDWLQGGPCRYS